MGFGGRETLGAVAEAGATPPPEVVASVEEPLERWAVAGSGELPFSLTFEARTPPAEYGGRIGLVKTGGMEGYEQLCRVRGTVGSRTVDGLGQRGHSWGNPDWDRIALTRSVSAWFDDGSGSVLSAVRPVKASSHADEAIWAAVFDGSRALTVDEPRLSTTTDSAGRQIRAGLEFWLDKDDDYPTARARRRRDRFDAGARRAAPRRRLLCMAHRRPRGRRALRHHPPRVIKAVVSDFGGVVTLPLIEGFKRAHAEIGVPIEALGQAMQLTAARASEPPLWTLERGQMTEADFISGLEAALSEVTGRPVTLDGYGTRLMGELEPNEPLLARYRELREPGRAVGDPDQQRA